MLMQPLPPTSHSRHIPHVEVISERLDLLVAKDGMYSYLIP